MVSAPPNLGLRPLDRYIASPDPSYRWNSVATLPRHGCSIHMLELVSQCWRDRNEVDRPAWRHQLTLVVPDEIASHTGLLIIAGGSNERRVAAQVNPVLAAAATASPRLQYADTCPSYRR